jgi:hypothetical protein
MITQGGTSEDIRMLAQRQAVIVAAVRESELACWLEDEAC